MADFRTVQQIPSWTTEQFDSEVRRLQNEGFRIVSGGSDGDGMKFVMMQKPDDTQSTTIEINGDRKVIREI